MNNSHIRGRNYEIQIYEYLTLNFTNYDIYEWKNIPFKFVETYKFVDLTNYSEETNKSFMDVGCDIFMVNKNNNSDVILVQCKNYEKNNVRVDDLAGFFQLIALTSIPLSGLIISNTPLCNQITFRLKHINSVKFLNVPYEEKKIVENIEDIPRDYQLEAVEKFKNIDKGILQLFCGMGKTYTSILISENFNNIVILSPLRTYACQLLDVFCKKLKTHTSNLISSDGSRDLNIILNNKKEKNIYSATFCSSDVVYALLNHLDDVILIVDEFHNLSFNNITDKDNILYKILTFNKINKKLFISATLKVYEPINKNEEYIEHSVDNYENIFGKVFYSYDFKLAVQNNYVNDYQIIIPDIEKDKNKFDFVYFNMLYHGYKKCLIYCKSIKDCEMFMTEIKNINKETYNFNIYVNTITHETSYNARNKILNNFKKDITKLNFIISIHTLDECVDIPECDSVYITYDVKNSINIIQRISRSLRIYKNKKKSGIFLWCEKYKDLLKINKIIKEYNIQIIDKVFIKYNEKSDVIKKKIKNVLDEMCCNENIVNENIINENIVNKIVVNKNIINENIVNEIIVNENIVNKNIENKQNYCINDDVQFNNDYHAFYKMCENKFFGIELDKIMEYLEYKDVTKFIERLRKKFKLNIDYEIIKKEKLEHINARRVIYYVSLDCFERICFCSKQQKAINITNFFINLRKKVNVVQK